MLKLAAFADEISPDIDEQIKHCKLNGVTHFELRSADGTNVLDFSDEQRKTYKSKMLDAGMGVASIGSPIGKVKIDESWDAHFDRFKVAVEMAEFFEAPLIRIFSYYPPEGKAIANYFDEVLRRMRAKCEYIGDRSVTLVHENEKGILGEKGATCAQLMADVGDKRLRSAFDFANFVQANDDPMVNWHVLKPYTAHIHIKDAIAGSGRVVPAGEGDGSIAKILDDAYQSGYRGFLSLEPHLKVAGHSHGETGPDLFKTAVDALRNVCRQASVPLAS